MAEKAYTIDPIEIDLPMPILTPRLLIRPPQPGDGEILARAVDETWDDLHVWFHKHMGTKEQETNPRVKEAWVLRSLGEFQSRSRMILFGFDRETGDFVVSTGFHNPEWRVRRFEIDYWVTKSQQGQGYALEAANALIRYAFDVMVARVVTTGHAEGNAPSQRIIEKLGFKHSITKPFDYEMLDGSLVNGHGYCLLDKAPLPPLDVQWGRPYSATPPQLGL